jgi:hypothetical protein
MIYFNDQQKKKNNHHVESQMLLQINWKIQIEIWKTNLPNANLLRKVCRMCWYFSAIERMLLGALSREAFSLWRLEEKTDFMSPLEAIVHPDDSCWE